MLAFAWFAGGLTTFTRPAEVTIFVAGAAVLGYATVARRRPTDEPLGRIGFVAWAAWLAAVTGWELWALFSAPRSLHPTVSSLLDVLIQTHPTRSPSSRGWCSAGGWPGGDSMRLVTTLGYAVLTLAAVGLQLLAGRADSRLRTAPVWLAAVARSGIGRWTLLVLWWWVGWHFFVR